MASSDGGAVSHGVGRDDAHRVEHALGQAVHLRGNGLRPDRHGRHPGAVAPAVGGLFPLDYEPVMAWFRCRVHGERHDTRNPSESWAAALTYAGAGGTVGRCWTEGIALMPILFTVDDVQSVKISWNSSPYHRNHLFPHSAASPKGKRPRYAAPSPGSAPRGLPLRSRRGRWTSGTPPGPAVPGYRHCRFPGRCRGPRRRPGSCTPRPGK